MCTLLESEYRRTMTGWSKIPRLSTMQGRAAIHAEDISANVMLATLKRIPKTQCAHEYDSNLSLLHQ